MEEHCRRARGETPWTKEYDLSMRIGNLTKFKRRLEDLQKKEPEEVQVG